ncbi:hypothetical protein AA0118_g114 [Alternaria tenuissima]|nr:hypothetical protein AA0118_g114 [Alternaria tenuissima]RYO02208.1 hypothetical protein AA0120_g749 [Alternaria tenuissima]
MPASQALMGLGTRLLGAAKTAIAGNLECWPSRMLGAFDSCDVWIIVCWTWDPLLLYASQYSAGVYRDSALFAVVAVSNKATT